MQKTRRYSSKENLAFFGACMFFASLNFEVFSVIGDFFSVGKLFALLYLILLIRAIPIGQLFALKNIRGAVTNVFSMLAFMILSSIIHNSDTIIDTTILVNIIFFVILLNHSRHDSRVFKDGLVYLALSSSALAVLVFFGLLDVKISGDGRLTILGDNANAIALKMGASILIILSTCLNHEGERKVYKPLLLVLIIPLLLILVKTGSRSGFLAFAMGIMLFFFLLPAKKLWIKIIWMFVGGLILFFGWKFVEQQEVLMARLEHTVTDGSLAGRDELWAIYIEIIKDNPILGVGFSGGNEKCIALSHYGKAMSPHNVFVEVALYSGIIGLLFFVSFMYKVLHGGIKSLKKNHDLNPILLFVIIFMMVCSGQALGIKLFWIISAYCLSYWLSNQDHQISYEEKICTT